MAVTPKLNFTRVSISDALSAENTRPKKIGARVFSATEDKDKNAVFSVLPVPSGKFGAPVQS